MALLTDEIQEKLIKLLIDEGLVEKRILDDAETRAKKEDKPLFSLLTEEGVIDNELLTHAVAQVSGVPYVNLSNSFIDQNILSLLPAEVAERFMAVPLAEVQNRLAVAMIDANNVQAVDYLANRIQRPLKVFMASEDSVRHVLGQYKADLSTVSDAAQVSQEEAAIESATEIKTIVQDSPISRALSTILEYAVKSHASDVHIEPLEKALKIRCRVDGVLREVMQLPKSIEPALVSRIKILSSLKIDEHRIPQDGQFAVNVAGKAVDLRIAISPVVWGEQVVIRLLDKTGNSFDLEDMGYAGRALRSIRKGIKRPNGMILTSGPTGSGKSTSLYALIKEIKDDSVNIVTLEDPVEYKMDGVNQIQVNTEVGLTFASGLRSILRQDPDVVMVGEIRDNKTTRTAIQASITGHLVLSSFHANSTAAAFSRMIDMIGQNPIFSSAVRLLIAQRLVRRLHDDSKEEYEPDEATRRWVKETLKGIPDTVDCPDLDTFKLWRPVSTPEAPFGYKGRIPVMEQLIVTEEIQKFLRGDIVDIHAEAIEEVAKKQGTITLLQAGVLAALRGETTIEEVNRVI